MSRRTWALSSSRSWSHRPDRSRSAVTGRTGADQVSASPRQTWSVPCTEGKVPRSQVTASPSPATWWGIATKSRAGPEGPDQVSEVVADFAFTPWATWPEVIGVTRPAIVFASPPSGTANQVTWPPAFTDTLVPLDARAVGDRCVGPVLDRDREVGTAGCGRHPEPGLRHRLEGDRRGALGDRHPSQRRPGGVAQLDRDAEVVGARHHTGRDPVDGDRDVGRGGPARRPWRRSRCAARRTRSRCPSGRTREEEGRPAGPWARRPRPEYQRLVGGTTSLARRCVGSSFGVRCTRAAASFFTVAGSSTGVSERLTGSPSATAVSPTEPPEQGESDHTGRDDEHGDDDDGHQAGAVRGRRTLLRKPAINEPRSFAGSRPSRRSGPRGGRRRAATGWRTAACRAR